MKRKPILSEARRRRLRAIFARLRSIERSSLTGAVSQRRATQAYAKRQELVSRLKKEIKRKKALIRQKDAELKRKRQGLVQYRGAIKWI